MYTNVRRHICNLSLLFPIPKVDEEGYPELRMRDVRRSQNDTDVDTGTEDEIYGRRRKSW